MESGFARKEWCAKPTRDTHKYRVPADGGKARAARAFLSPSVTFDKTAGVENRETKNHGDQKINIYQKKYTYIS